MRHLISAICVSILVGCQASPPTRSNTTKPTTQDSLPSYFTEINSPAEDIFPFVGSFLREDRSLIGSGILIAPDVVLTAGHVVEDGTAKYFDFISSGCYPITDIVLHPQYKVGRFLLHDIAIVFLEDEVDVQPIKLISAEDVCYKGKPLTTIGYSDAVKKYSNAGTFWYYGRLLREPQYMKMLPLKASVWFGDSGGAIIALFGSEWKLVGVISSFSYTEGIVYENSGASVKFYETWIEEVMNERGLDGQDTGVDTE
tara:strand:- start:19312 stop:20079 length:768 start_codon:yes stop_codon:yes gene_type:complete